ncbi:unnamed protein product [Blepharisma stoltei]|uniref:Uncharacterized protein n=1 Tax=Blepharisma stoltei TaxID=1481888 RepID=A0AAU9JM79_9CILI|nr:unnamed protein product [Blepharisma stoltei]
MVLQWKVMFWRWIPNKRQNLPKVIVGLTALSLVTHYYRTALGEYNTLEGKTHDYATSMLERSKNIYDQEAMKILAKRRQKMIKDQEEAKEYFKTKGYVPRPTNGNMVVNDILGY